jgi:uncharacterized protein YegP (UPF0339 family)
MKWVSLSCVVLALALLVGFSGPAVGGGGGKKAKDKAADTGKDGGAAVFEIAKDKKKAFRFVFKGPDGKTLFMSVGSGFKTREDCVKAIDAIRAQVGKAKIVDRK